MGLLMFIFLILSAVSFFSGAIGPGLGFLLLSVMAGMFSDP
jgi:hypothetical protein